MFQPCYHQLANLIGFRIRLPLLKQSQQTVRELEDRISVPVHLSELFIVGNCVSVDSPPTFEFLLIVSTAVAYMSMIHEVHMKLF